jgi:futalosine hydrolase
VPVRILYITSTLLESDTLQKIRKKLKVTDYPGKFELMSLVSGIGSIATAWNMKNWIEHNGKPDLAINAGIAGSFKDDLITGDIVSPLTDCFADSGIEDGNDFFTLAEAGLTTADEFPYKNGLLYADALYINKIKHIIKPVRAITVNTATGSETTRIKLIKKFNPDIETMEGATFFYICSREKIPFLAVRAISNKIELRNKNNWNIPLALNNLSDKIIDVLLTLQR